jgi:carboxyl-terminal processing protease
LGNQTQLLECGLSRFQTIFKAQNISFDTETELALKNTLAVAKKEKIDATIITEYQQLLAALQKSEETLLDKNQEEIRNLILMKSSNDTNIKRVCINII